MIKERAERADNLLQDCGVEAMLFLDLANIRYLCGFTGTDGALVVTGSGDAFLTDSRYTTQARNQVAAGELLEYRVKIDGIVDYLRRSGVRRIGFEAEKVPFSIYKRFQEKGNPDWDWIPVDKPVLSLRGQKAEEEIRHLEKAAALNREALEEVLPQIRPGVREKDLALALEFALKRRGGEEKAFDFIVASGERGALPHGLASDREIKAGELVTIDFGTRWQGYHSDETVTFAIGAVEPRLREIYDTVLEAHDRALAAVRPGVALKDLDEIARRFIADKGYGDYFGHGLGHGVGLEVHEYPAVSTRSEEVAAPGMVITIEPGIYLPEFGGVRIEDMVLVTEYGCRVLTQVPKDFRSLPLA